MKDGVPKQTGNSRYLKSAIAEDITFEQFRDLLRSGTLPVDLNGINADGWAELGTPLNKASLMSGTVESQYGLSATNVPSDVFVKIKNLIDTANSNISSLENSKAEITTGSYTGNDSASRTISLGYMPKAVLVINALSIFSIGSFPTQSMRFSAFAVASRNAYGLSIVSNGFKVEHNSDQLILNQSGYAYNYIAFK